MTGLITISHTGFLVTMHRPLQQMLLMVTLVERMLTLNKQRADVKTDHEKTLIDRQIDALVYELYGLTAEEIAIVEGVGK